ncbi:MULTISPECIES: ABC transporter ATP-binding protein [unclassified Mesorhizobium]|uniref:ABC transporter ATP-binding protein n=1 Tax=unclassified Mesorhizobium TaxID=325217 RepID=UPI001FF064CC|nr:MULTISPECIES: ABC transporter ATP-binding protein [unclassified Mesorhizobium]
MTTLNVDPRVALTNIQKWFGKFHALRDVSFSLQPGEFLTLLGPSGSGKTTTLRAIAGFLDPDSGDVRIDGKSVVGVPPHRRNIGMVFQDYALFPHMSARRNVGYPLRARGEPASSRERMVDEILDVVGLLNLADRLPSQLSGGQRQRVALARALVFRPSLVLLDEPLSALDRKLRGQMQTEITRIVHDFGATVVSVTHDQEEALAMSDRIALFNKGAIEQIGSPKDLYLRPGSPFVADFVGEANLLRGRCENGKIIGDGWAVSDGSSRREGRDVFIVVRPENVVVRPMKNPLVSENEFRGEILDCTYLGAEQKMTVRLGRSTCMRSRMPNSGSEEATLSPSMSVVVSWQAKDVLVLPA